MPILVTIYVAIEMAIKFTYQAGRATRSAYESTASVIKATWKDIRSFRYEVVPEDRFILITLTTAPFQLTQVLRVGEWIINLEV